MLEKAFKNLRFLKLGQSSIYNQTVKKHTTDELKKDLFGKGDMTTNLLGKRKNKVIEAEVVAKAEGILAGIEEVKWFLKKNKIRFQSHKKDGEKIKRGDVVLSLKGKAKHILETERVALNLLQRMSGIATLTSKQIKKIPSNILLAATRKTLWGLIDKKAVIVGGGAAHRLGLWHAILIKDNHLMLDSAENLLTKAWQTKKQGAFIEIEADTAENAIEYAEIIKKLREKKSRENPIIIMLDNFKDNEIEAIAQKIKEIDSEIYVEISGGITPDNLERYGKLKNIDIISSGFLTHSVIALDLSMRIKQI